MARICLISPSHVASNPRLVKEADALHAAGHDVHVVAGWYFPPLDRYDAEIYSAAPWSRTVVYYMTGPRVTVAKLLHKFARFRAARTSSPSLRLAARACHPAVSLLAATAKSIPAHLYIGHCLAALPAAARAARARNVPYGFDAEDFHSAETTASTTDHAESSIVRKIESSLLPGCTHLTAASPLIAQAYADTYHVKSPATVLNAFPLSHSPASPAPGSPPGSPPRLYWFSQTIGPGRGLEPLVAALARMHTRCELHLRGIASPGFQDDLRHLAKTAGFTGKIEFLPIAAAGEMARLAAGFDLGLSLEQSTPRNRDLCLTNKIFTYLLAGLPVAFTPTSAQSALIADLGDAAFQLDLDAPARAATSLDAFFQNPARRAAARAAAWHLGHSRYNWEFEQRTFLNSVESALRR